MTDNGSAYRIRLFREACAAAKLRHLRTRPYTPRTNGKAERFIQTVLRECAYAHPFQSVSVIGATPCGRAAGPRSLAGRWTGGPR
jgi:transposase InsO family protein